LWHEPAERNSGKSAGTICGNNNDQAIEKRVDQGLEANPTPLLSPWINPAKSVRRDILRTLGNWRTGALSVTEFHEGDVEN